MLWGSNVNLGSLKSKGRFHYKWYNSSMLHSLTMIRLRPSTYFMGSNVNLGSIGVTGGKRHFRLKWFNLSMLHGMTIWLIHEHQLETLHLFYGSNVNLGSALGHPGRVRRLWRQQILVRSVTQWLPFLARKLSLMTPWFDASVGASPSLLNVSAPPTKTMHAGQQEAIRVMFPTILTL